MQEQKHEQVKQYNRNTRDLPSLKAGNTIYFQLVSNMRNWIPGVIIEKVSALSYRVKTTKGGIYIRNRKFIKIKHTDSRQHSQTTQKVRTPDHRNTHTGRPKRATRRPQRLIEFMNLIRAWNTCREPT